VKLFTAEQWAKLRANGQKAAKDPYFNPPPVVKLFTPDAPFTWLLAWVEPDDEDIAYGLCDLGMGCPEIGSVRLSEIRAIRGRLRLPVERDRWWEPRKSLMEYADDARRAGGVR
jgi:hypothetical protein